MPAPDRTGERALAGVPSQADDVDAGTFRAVMASVCTPVSVVTTMAGDRPHGTTVSAFASLSLSPPMILVSLDLGSDLLRHIQGSGVFGLNILRDGQADLAVGFARKGDDKFTGVSWTLHGGIPRLAGCASWLGCVVERMVDGGDHVVVFGRVTDADDKGSPPLTYHKRRFGTHKEHADDVPSARPLTGRCALSRAPAARS
jgi:flavin reductase (DIM6/NTAB) family NADH-FMN oxidoreductase RutF